jgi:hypothetical protein
MAIISIIATALESEIIAGVPQLLGLDTNVPSTIFYTLDNSPPDTSSLVYVNPIVMPTDGTTRLRALAISGPDTGTLDITFKADTSAMRYPRRSSNYGAGIVVDAYDIDNVLMDGYGLDENWLANQELRSSDYELQDLDLKFSRTGVNGEGRGTLLHFGFTPPDRDKAIDNGFSSPNNNNVFFNPRALYIVIDGRKDDDVFDGYKIINRPNSGTLNYRTYLNGRTIMQPIVSGGFIRTFYDARNSVSVSYFFDFIECRWVKSINNYDGSTWPVGLGTRKSYGPGLIFKWIYNKRSAI